MASFISAAARIPPVPLSTPLIDAMTGFYSMGPGDIVELSAQLEEQMTAQYRVTIQSQLLLYGCNRSATGPDAQSLASIQRTSRTTADGIARTYNRELRNKVQSLYSANRRGNRNYYFKALEAWTVKRNAYKLDSIALNTMTAARKYAQERFVEQNGIAGRWVFTGPPPVCKVCIRIKALGVVSLAVSLTNPLPAHVNCPHTWSQVIPKKIDCAEAWTG